MGPTNVAIHIYPFVPLLHPTSQISSKRVLATPFCITGQVGSISLGRAKVGVQIEAAAPAAALLALYRPR